MPPGIGGFAFLVIPCKLNSRGNMRVGFRLILIAVSFFSLTSCFNGSPAELVFFDFESDVELDRIHWKCRTLFSLSNENVTHGVKSLRLELYPSNYPGVATKLGINDWRRYNALSFDVYNPEDEKTSIAVRIDDKKDYPDYKDRYNKSFILKPGLNHLNIPLSTLITSGTDRVLDLKKIYRFLIFMVNPQKRHVLYIDYVRLR